MSEVKLDRALECSVDAVRAAGRLLRRHMRGAKAVKLATAHDIKLELDVQCQSKIEAVLRRAFPNVPILGEEKSVGDLTGPVRWVVDPLDGTVNYAHGIPHVCVQIALQQRMRRGRGPFGAYETVLGVIYDPFQDELWTAVRGEPARLNGEPVRASTRGAISEAVVSVGFGKSEKFLDAILPCFVQLARAARKIRTMGSAGLGLAYVACGRFDAYIERGISLWDLAAGGVIVECAGGKFWCRKNPDDESFRMIASSKALFDQLPRFC
ncbi:MAG: inositol monophosphatase [Verrucomicrobiae bacterium]|nr:inositol monophosphatase [Verrucomicrobiae bacterium]MCX7721901.1 inositol monophosphatase [Verrucomicrobiae bacterium]MDW7980085.1 inositol monophosphatase family protein [Verrucomicrobiales bacterium]